MLCGASVGLALMVKALAPFWLAHVARIPDKSRILIHLVSFRTGFLKMADSATVGVVNLWQGVALRVGFEVSQCSAVNPRKLLTAGCALVSFRGAEEFRVLLP